VTLVDMISRGGGVARDFLLQEELLQASSLAGDAVDAQRAVSLPWVDHQRTSR
jgi:hypothetical protein